MPGEVTLLSRRVSRRSVPAARPVRRSATKPTTRRSIAFGIISLAACAAVALSGGSAIAVPPPPGNPSDGQLDTASVATQQVSDQVKALSAQVTTAQTQLDAVQSEAQLAQEMYNKALIDLQTAQTTADETKAALEQARVDVETASAAVSDFARASYMHGSTLDSGLVLLAADGPAQLVEQAGFLESLSQSHLDVLGQLEVAQVDQANADSDARQAVIDMQTAEDAAEQAKSVADAKVVQTQAAVATLTAQKTSYQQQLVSAQQQLADLQGQRAAYDEWLVAKQAEEAAAAAAAAAAAESYGGDDGGGESVGSWDGGGSWTPEMGQAVVEYAMQWLGTSYAWGGGTPSGPSWGFGIDDGVHGFDCSGLALYAWAQVGVYLPHYSGYQRNSGQHISYDEIMPGDLVFWKYSNGVIHHVAIYIGDGMIVQAPQSGDVVKVSRMYFSGYAGATRPGT